MKQKFSSKVMNEQGQMILEYILLSVLVVGISVVISTSLRQNEILGKLVSSPWKSLAGMIQNGSWGDPQSTMLNHPNHHANSATQTPEKVN